MNTEQKYDVDYFIAKFEAIPEDRWCVGEFSMLEDSGMWKHCAIGHCRSTYGGAINSSEVDGLLKLFNHDLDVQKMAYIAKVNDGLIEEYPQSTPKQRVLAALRDLKVVEAPVKERIVYVSLDSDIKEEVKKMLETAEN